MWKIIQCAVQGRSHLKSNIPCQDKTYSMIANNTQVIALADGAGSAKLSHYGADIATKFICLELTINFDNYFSNNNGVEVKLQLVKKIIEHLKNQAQILQCDLKDLASTLLFVAIKKQQFIIAHIGDGVIGYLKDNELKVASYPENGEFINSTTFVTSKNSITNMKLFKGYLKQITGFVLMSDGTEMSLYNKKEQKLANILKKIMQISTIIPTNKIEYQLQQSFENVISKATTDDCSIIMLVNTDKNFKGYLSLSHIQKCKLLNINPQSAKRTVKKYDNILLFLLNKNTLSQVAKKIHLQKKYAQKYIDKLYKLNLIEKDGLCYHTILIMNKN